ncbi:MAG: class I SAM-dependent methyltransferase [Actinomycetota bacterium]
MEPTDPRIAARYDVDNPDGPDHDFYRALVHRVDPEVVVDLGCGTGILTVTLVSAGRTVIGVDPDAGMLDVARNRPGSERVTWQLGDSRLIGGPVDVVVMTGNVAQHIGPHHWERTLADISTALRPGGTVAFETRNPTVQAWRGWTRDATIGTRPTRDGPLTEWIDATEPDAAGTVILTATNHWEATGEELIVRQPLTFRSLRQIEEQLDAVGLVVRQVFGGWSGEPFDSESPLLVVESGKP